MYKSLTCNSYLVLSALIFITDQLNLSPRAWRKSLTLTKDLGKLDCSISFLTYLYVGCDGGKFSFTHLVYSTRFQM